MRNLVYVFEKFRRHLCVCLFVCACVCVCVEVGGGGGVEWGGLIQAARAKHNFYEGFAFLCL